MATKTPDFTPESREKPFTISCTFPSRSFRSVPLKLTDKSSNQIVLSVHPLILSLRSPFFDKVAFPRLFEIGQDEVEHPVSLPVFDAWAVADVVNSFYGEETNTGKRPAWEHILKFQQAKDFLLMEKFSMDCLLSSIPTEPAEFDEYLPTVLSLAEDMSPDSGENDKDSFLQRLIGKVGNFYYYFGIPGARRVMDAMCQNKAVSPALIKNLVEKMPYGSVAVFEGMVGLLELCLLPEETRQEVWGELILSVGEKYGEVAQEYIERYEKLGFWRESPKTPANIAGLHSNRVVSLDLKEESSARLYGLSASITRYDVSKGKFLFGTHSGIVVSDLAGKETLIKSVENYYTPTIVKIFKDVMLVADNNRVLGFNPETNALLWEKDIPNVFCDNKGNLYAANEGKIYVWSASGRKELEKGPTKTLPGFSVASSRGKFLILCDKDSEKIYLVNTTDISASCYIGIAHLDKEKIFFSNCEKYLIVGNGKTVKSAFLSTDNIKFPWKELPGVVIGVSKNKNIMALFQPGKVIIQDFQDNVICNISVPFANYGGILAEFSEDGNMLALSGCGKTNVYDLRGFKEITEPFFSKNIQMTNIKFY